jgi:replication initiation protein RepC
MEIGVAGLERRQAEAQTRFETQLAEQNKDVHKDGVGPDSGPHIYTYKPPFNLNPDTVIASDRSSSGGGARPETGPKPQSPTETEERGAVLRLHPEELAVLAPRLAVHLRADYPKWSDIVDAADALRNELDVSRSLWGEACQTLGREMAAIALAIVSTKDPDYFTRTPGHYFHGMVERAKRGELHLDRTLWGLRSVNKRDKATEGTA